jgi:glycosyltransferase involved in cell wall biosynthesis
MSESQTIPVLIIPVLNRYDLLDKNLSSIDHKVNEILIINNGKETFVPSNNNLNVKILDLPSNLGVAGSWNLGIKLYPHVPFWMFSCADVYWIPGRMSKFASMCNKDELVYTNVPFGTWSIGENLIKAAGLFDEQYYPIYFEDTDYVSRLKHLNLSNKMVYSEIEMGLSGEQQTIMSDPELFTKNEKTFKLNESTYNSKSSAKNWSIIGWTLESRREKDWS